MQHTQVIRKITGNYRVTRGIWEHKMVSLKGQIKTKASNHKSGRKYLNEKIFYPNDSINTKKFK